MKEKHVNESRIAPSGLWCFIHILCVIFLFLTSPWIRFPSLFQSFVMLSVCIFLSIPYPAAAVPRAQDPSSDPWLADGVVTAVCLQCFSSRTGVCILIRSDTHPTPSDSSGSRLQHIDPQLFI